MAISIASRGERIALRCPQVIANQALRPLPRQAPPGGDGGGGDPALPDRPRGAAGGQRLDAEPGAGGAAVSVSRSTRTRSRLDRRRRARQAATAPARRALPF